MGWLSGILSDGRPPAGAKWLPYACLALCLSGCRTPAARFSTGTIPDSGYGCSSALTRHLLDDSAVALACHPLRSGLELVGEPAVHVCRVCQGAVGKRVVLPLQEALDPVPPTLEAVPFSASAVEQRGDYLSAKVRLFVNGPESMIALSGLIDSGVSQIDVLMFQWENDPLGAAIADRLALRARAGVRVRVLVDGGGNLLFGQPPRGRDNDVNGVVRELARQGNVEVIRNRIHFARFDHRKLVVVDGRIAWSGGRNFTQHCFSDDRDLSFTVEGPLVAKLECCFESSWEDQGGAASDAALPETSLPPPLWPGMSNAMAKVVRTEPWCTEIEAALYAAVDRAHTHIFLENFAFSDSLLIYKLAKARRRGVDVRVVLTVSPSCTEFVRRGNMVTANRLLQAGVRVYVYPGMTHVKAATVDGQWAYMGTGNFDHLSLRRNRELGLILGESPLIAELDHRLFGVDFRPDWEMKKLFPVSARDYWCELVASACL